jgi:hypothetical protein
VKRFHPKLERALKELAGLPWKVRAGAIRCEDACPVSAAGIAAGGDPKWDCNFIEPAKLLGVTSDDAWSVAEAADYRNNSMRPRLLELLGMEPNQ